MSPRTVSSDLLLSLLGGTLLILSFPNFDLGILAWVALVPLLLAIDGKTPVEAYLLTCFAGVAFVLGMSYWIWIVPTFKLFAGVLAGFYIAQHLAVWGLGVAFICRRTSLPLALVAPCVWVAVEYLRSHVSFLSLPWLLLGQSQHSSLALVQLSSLTGVYGLSFLIVLVNTAIAQALLDARRLGESAAHRPRVPRSVIVASMLLIGAFGYGAAVIARYRKAETMKIAIVQGNIPQDRKWDRRYRQDILAEHARLTREVASQRPAMIVWPETAVPGDVLHDPTLREQVAAIARETGAYLLVGSSEYAKFSNQALRTKHYNSMVLFGPGGDIAGQYRKIILVPFAEYEPVPGLVQWPRTIVPAFGAFAPAEDYTVFAVGPLAVGATICWENIFPDLVREFVKRGANLIVNATNEAWFGETAAPRQFLAMSIFRAAEHRIAVVRAANTGISAVIDPLGRVVDRVHDAEGKAVFVSGALTADVPITTTRTFYTQHGDVFAAGPLAAVGLMLGGAAAPSRVRNRFRRLWKVTERVAT
jgi:apolipoprotein N-acyltransferase